MKAQGASRPNLAGLTILTAASSWVAWHLSPLIVLGEIQVLPAICVAVAVICAIRLLSEGLSLLARFTDWHSSHSATGKEGTARWGRVRDLKKDLLPEQKGPFWGRTVMGKGVPLFIDYVSNAMTIAPAGSGKGIYTVITNILSVCHAKVVADFKGELICIVIAALKARGEQVRVLNPGGLWKEIVGQGDCYNPQDIFVDDLYRPGGLRDVPDDLREVSAQILPNPGESETDNSYFWEGSRSIISFGILLLVMLDLYDATLSCVALLIEDRNALENHLRWVVGIDLEGKPLPEGPLPIEALPWAEHHTQEDVREFTRLVRSRAGNLLALMGNRGGSTFDSFITGAQQALSPFAFGRLAPAMGRSTFSMDDLKNGDVTTSLFIVADASRMEAYEAYVGLIQWCAMTAIKRHPNKERPVHLIMDEATNYKIHGLDSLLTWGRSYGLHLHLIFQDLAACERVYGQHALDPLLSETEIKQFLPQQRSPKTLELIEKMLGNQSVKVAGQSAQGVEQGLHEQMSESARPLMTADEIRRSEHGLLFVRDKPPLLIEPVSYAEIDPWRTQAGINPFHGKPFLKKTKIRLRHQGGK